MVAIACDDDDAPDDEDEWAAVFDEKGKELMAAAKWLGAENVEALLDKWDEWREWEAR